MLESWTIVGKAQADALANAESAENFWSSMPRDPFEMQRRLCDELAKGAGWERPDINRFRALRQHDRRANRLLEAFLSEYAALSGQSPVIGRQLWHAALELSRSFAHDYERFLRVACNATAGSAWIERTPELLVRLFRHREVELLLALCRYERWPRARWKSLHTAYRFASAQGVETRAVPVARLADKTAITDTPQQAYLRILLLQLLDGGQFRPGEITQARRHIGRWSEGLALQRLHALMNDADSPNGFVVDLACSEGLARARSAAAADLLWLDTTPIAQSIDAAIAEGRESTAAVGAATPQVEHLDLLRKLQRLYAPQPAQIKRRGERIAAALMSAEAALGDLQAIFRMLRDEARRAIAASNVPMPYADEITITDVGSTRAATASTPAGSSANSASGAAGALHSSWHIRDRSDSGCRLRGRIPDARFVMPGLLMAYRADKVGPWTVAVVRRLDKLMGNNVEVGVEHLGRNPQRVILLANAQRAAETGSPPQPRPERFAALYLPESKEFPRMPMKTLLMPTCEFAPGRVITMLSTTKEVAIRLKEPLERQPDFVWTSFEAVEIGAAADRESSHSGQA